jgi:hypothetical protein
MRKLLANPAEMIARGAPRLIRNDQELAARPDSTIRIRKRGLDVPGWTTKAYPRSDAEAERPLQGSE